MDQGGEFWGDLVVGELCIHTAFVGLHFRRSLSILACSCIGASSLLLLSGGANALPKHDCVEPVCLFLEGSCFSLIDCVEHFFLS